MKISTATSVFINYPIQEAAKEILGAGYDGIDLWCGRPHLYRRDHSPEELRSLLLWLEESRLTPVSCMPAFFRYPYSLSNSREVVRQDSIAYMKETIDIANALSASSVLVVPTHSLYGQTVQDARAWFVDSLVQVCHYAETRGVKLGIEIVYPALSDYMNKTDDALEVIREVDSPCLGIVLDTGHLNLSGEDIESAFLKANEFLLQIHVNDNNSLIQQNAIPGEGSYDFPKLAGLLHQHDYHGFLTVEIGWQYSFDPVPAVTQARERMLSYLSA